MHEQVRDAGEEAWLGREAPYNPDLDAEDDQQPPLLLMPPPASGDSHEQPAQMAGEACPPGTTLVPGKSLVMPCPCIDRDVKLTITCALLADHHGQERASQLLHQPCMWVQWAGA